MHTTSAALLALVPLLGPATPAPAPSGPALEGPALEDPVLEDPVQDGPPKESAADDHEWTQEELERVAAEIQVDIEKLRGQEFVRPVAVKLASVEDLMTYVETREAKTETPEEFAADETIAKMLGVVPNHVDLRKAMRDLLAGQVAGFYDPDTDSFSLMKTCPLGLARITMAHELVHALDDQLYEIDERLEAAGDATDAQLAFWCVVEGSATVVMNLWAVQNMADLGGALDEANEIQMDALEKAPMWLWKPMLGAYLRGASFLQRKEGLALGKARTEDVARAFRTPPSSTEQVLHPSKYWTQETADTPRKLDYEAVALPEGWTILQEDTLGELAAAIVVTPEAKRRVDLRNPLALVGLEFTNAAATGWDGDRVVLAGRGQARVMQWTSVWDDAESAREFFAALEAQFDALEQAVGELGTSFDLSAGVALQPGAAEDTVVLTTWIDTLPGEAQKVAAGLRAVEPATD